MKRKKLIVPMVLSLLVAACSSGNAGNSVGSTDASTDASGTGKAAGQASQGTESNALKPYDLTMAVPIFGAIPPDVQVVQDELNKLTQAKINTTVTILPISIGAWGQQMNLMMSGGEKLDVAFSMGAGGMYQSAAATGKLYPLDDLLEKYGQGIVEQVGQEYVEGARYNGKLYAVPTNRNFGQAAALFMRKDLVEKHNIDVAAIKTIDDLDNVFNH